jgi:hypothetical protein
MPGTPPTRFTYLGPEGTFTEAALRTIPAAEHGLRTPARSVPEALEAVHSGEADAAVKFWLSNRRFLTNSCKAPAQEGVARP